MKLQLARHLWGVDLRQGLEPFGKHWRDFGYQIIECGIPGDGPDRDLHAFRKTYGFGWIAMVFTRAPKPGGGVADHLQSLRAQIEAALPHKPLFINSHSGSDTWEWEQNLEFFRGALALEKSFGIALSHETHRQRSFSTPWMTRRVLENLPELKITADYSHWVTVCERLLPDMEETLALCAGRALHVHARVGFEEGPQVPDPFAPEWSHHLAAHERWWEEIWADQRRRGLATTTLTPEFGPFPYLHHLPYTQAPVADLAKICDGIAARQRNRFDPSPP
ncbi:MAG: sugar phosphate isomerase/epimerase [Spirochaetes bacterium]|nr:sugar phosphate isomerase/epimerase [Spirochaetota bacterium]